MNILYLTTDLIFSSRVTSVAKAQGINLTVISEAELLIAKASENNVDLVIIDLTMSELDPKKFVLRLRKLANSPKTIIAYGPHVQHAKLDAARDAGCDEVFSKGEFNNQMHDIIRS